MHNLVPLHLSQQGRAEYQEILWKSQSSPANVFELVEPTVIWDTAKEVVPFVNRLESPKTILEVVPSSALQAYAIDIEPCSPKDAPNPGHMPVERTSGIRATAELDDTLDVEIHNANRSVSG